jgi:hypothetical protein
MTRPRAHLVPYAPVIRIRRCNCACICIIVTIVSVMCLHCSALASCGCLHIYNPRPWPSPRHHAISGFPFVFCKTLCACVFELANIQHPQAKEAESQKKIRKGMVPHGIKVKVGSREGSIVECPERGLYMCCQGPGEEAFSSQTVANLSPGVRQHELYTRCQRQCAKSE